MNGHRVLVVTAVGLAVAVGLAAGYRWGSSAVPATVAPIAATPEVGKKEPKLLFYRNPMGLPDTSPVPKKDPMGMDYIPVYEGEGQAGGPATLSLSTEKVQKLGVRTEVATLRQLDRVVRAAGRIEVDERRVFTIAPKFEGWIDRLYVNVSGQAVGKGQPLFEVYSPELVSAQREYAIAMQGQAALKVPGSKAENDAQRGIRQLAEASLTRLRNWDISEDQIKALAESGAAARQTLSFRSPVAGIVTEKKAVQGMRFMPGEALFQIADLSSVWVIADVFEQDIALVHTGSKVGVRIDAFPDKSFTGTVAYVYPTLRPETRTVPIRVELANPGGVLKPAMFAQVEVAGAGRDKVLTVPTSAVIDSGTRRIVLVQVAEGRFEPREVKLGQRGEQYVEIREGVGEGEAVVVTANFLIDAESNLKAALAGMSQPAASPAEHAGHAGHDEPAPAAKPEAPATTGHVHPSPPTDPHKEH